MVLLGRCQRLEVSWQQGEAGNKMGSATCNDSIETTKHGKDSKGIQGDGHLSWDSARKKNKSMK